MSLDEQIENEDDRHSPAKISNIDRSVGEEKELAEFMNDEVNYSYDYESDFEDVTGDSEKEKMGTTLLNEDIINTAELGLQEGETEEMSVNKSVDANVDGTNKGGTDTSKQVESSKPVVSQTR